MGFVCLGLGVFGGGGGGGLVWGFFFRGVESMLKDILISLPDCFINIPIAVMATGRNLKASPAHKGSILEKYHTDDMKSRSEEHVQEGLF